MGRILLAPQATATEKCRFGVRLLVRSFRIEPPPPMLMLCKQEAGGTGLY